MHTRAELIYIPLAICTNHYAAGSRTALEHSAHFSVWVTDGGKGKLFAGGERCGDVKDGSCFLRKPNDGIRELELMADPSSDMTATVVHFQQFEVFVDEIEQGAAKSALSIDSVFRSHTVEMMEMTPARMDSLLAQLRSSMAQSAPLFALRRQLTLYELLVHLLEHRKPESTQQYDPVQATIEYMERMLAKPLQINELPKLAGMTPSSYCRAFKKQTGMTPGSYLTRLRLLKAKELMADANTTLKDIAVSVGYQDELYFSRVFKKTEGISPSVYIKRSERKIAVVSSFLLQDHLLALGVLPIAAPSFPSTYMTPSGFPHHLHDKLAGTVPLDAERPIRSSDVVKLQPDLILRTKLRHDLGDRHWGEDGNAFMIDHSTTWEQYFRTIADWLDRRGEAERVIRHMVNLEQEARRKLSKAAKMGKWTIIRLLPGNCRIYGVKDHTFTELFYRRLQFQPDDRIEHGTYLDNSFDRLVELDPEQLLIIWSEESAVNQFATDPRWQQLRAVKESRIYYPESREWDPWGPIGREHMIKAMVKYFGALAP